jgi:hypothetical protein
MITCCDQGFNVKEINIVENKQIRAKLDSILTKEAKQDILDLINECQKLYHQLTLERNAQEVVNYDHFQEVRRLIDLQKEELIKSISDIANEMKNESKKCQKVCKEQSEHLESRFEDLKFGFSVQNFGRFFSGTIGSQFKTIKVWDLVTRKCLKTLNGHNSTNTSFLE